MALRLASCGSTAAGSTLNLGLKLLLKHRHSLVLQGEQQKDSDSHASASAVVVTTEKHITSEPGLSCMRMCVWQLQAFVTPCEDGRICSALKRPSQCTAGPHCAVDSTKLMKVAGTVRNSTCSPVVGTPGSVCWLHQSSHQAAW
jgi:hypothetical protein